MGTWTPLQKIGDFGGIVTMGCVEQLKGGRYMALFHDDGRFINGSNQAGEILRLQDAVIQRWLIMV